MLPVVVLMLCLSVVHSGPHPDPQLDQNWNLWKNQHNKIYNKREEGWRRLIWEKNLKKIKLHNLEHSMGKHTYTLGMNQFGDMTNEDFNQIMKGYEHRSDRRTEGSLFMKPNLQEIPSYVNWTAQGQVTPVKYQGVCNSSWAFSATGALEGQLFRKTGKLVPLSTQNLIDCSGVQGNYGCKGGQMDQAFQYVMDNGGLDCEASYPYQGKDQPCWYDPQYNSINITGFVDIPDGDEASLMLVVAAVGPVSVAVDATHSSFQFYKSGIYYEQFCRSQYANHGMLAVGYGAKKNYTSVLNYWIVKNSWGIGWGESGYILMSKDRHNNCGIASAASFPLIW